MLVGIGFAACGAIALLAAASVFAIAESVMHEILAGVLLAASAMFFVGVLICSLSATLGSILAEFQESSADVADREAKIIGALGQIIAEVEAVRDLELSRYRLENVALGALPAPSEKSFVSGAERPNGPKPGQDPPPPPPPAAQGGKIHTNCPSCQRSVIAPEHLAGRIVKCPGCQQSLEIPRRAGATESKR